MPTDVLAPIRAALGGPPASPGTEPWLAWLVVCLCRQRLRQRWLACLHRTVLADEPEHDGDLPGHEGWTFEYHGSGLRLVGPRETVDMDFHDGDEDGATIQTWFTWVRLASLDSPEPPEARLAAWRLDERPLLEAGVEELMDRGLLVMIEHEGRFRLSEELAALAEQLADVDFLDRSTASRWASLLEGERGQGPQTHAGFEAWCRSLVRDRRNAGILPELVGVLAPGSLDDLARSVLRGPVGTDTGRALEALLALGAEPGPEALALLRRLDPDQHHPFAPCQLFRWLLRSGQAVDEVEPLLLSFSARRVVTGYGGNPFDDHFALLALEFLPRHRDLLVHRGLFSDTPACVDHLAAVLTLLDEPWATRALLAAALESEDPIRKRSLVAFLQHTSDQDAARQGLALLPPPPSPDPRRPGFTYEEVAHANLSDSVARRLEGAKAVVERLRPH